MQADDKFLVYISPIQAIWSMDTLGDSNAVLMLTNTGETEAVFQGTVVWARG
jgi:hypothetical protein